MPRRTAATIAALGLAAGTLVATGAPASAATGQVTPVNSVDLSRYVGQWYQLAAIPAIFEAQCAKNVKANYAKNADGTVAVRNTCTTWINTTSAVNGTARVENAPKNSALTVSFFKLFGKQIYGNEANYLIFGLDPQYRWALVGSSDRGSGFVLSRTATLPASDLAVIKQKIAAAGYDVSTFQVTKQDGGAQKRVPLSSL